MINPANSSFFLRQSPPTVDPFQSPECPADRSAARVRQRKEGLGKTLFAAVGAATVFAGMAQPAVAEDVIEMDTPLLERVETEDITISEGEYQAHFKPVDLGLKPKLKSGQPSLGFRADLLDTTLTQEEKLDEVWSLTHTFNGRVRTELSTEGDTSVEVQARAHKTFERSLGDDFSLQFRVGGELGYQVAGENPGMNAAVELRQRVEGGNYQIGGHPFSVFAETRQRLEHHLGSGETDLTYRAQVGARTQIGLSEFGLPLELDLSVGPKIDGSTQGDALSPGIGAKLKLRPLG